MTPIANADANANANISNSWMDGWMDMDHFITIIQTNCIARDIQLYLNSYCIISASITIFKVLSKFFYK